jgi:DNA-directed RNA polymerase specialized sigma24 family protein
MNDKLNFSSTSPSSHDVESILVAYDPYIVSLMRKGTFTPLSFMDRDDITQQIRIKMMRALQEKSIHSLSQYMKSVAHNEYVSFMRRQKPALPLLDNDDEEGLGCREDELVALQEGFRDPQIEFEATNSYHECLETMVRAILALPKVQMRVAICSIRDRMDDPLSLTTAFGRHNLDISALQWPTDPKEKQRLQASYAPVRKKLAQVMGIDLTRFKGRGTARISCI